MYRAVKARQRSSVQGKGKARQRQRSRNLQLTKARQKQSVHRGFLTKVKAKEQRREIKEDSSSGEKSAAAVRAQQPRRDMMKEKRNYPKP